MELAIGVMGGIIGALLAALVAAIVAVRTNGRQRVINEANPHERATPAADMSIEFFRLVMREELGKLGDRLEKAIRKGNG